MARTISCDAPGCGQPAGFLLTVLASGAAQGLCESHFLGLCVGYVMKASGEEATSEQLAAGVALVKPEDAIDFGDLDGELYVCSGCGAEFPSLEMIEAHVVEAHATPPDEMGPVREMEPATREE